MIYYYGTTYKEFQKILKQHGVKLNKDKIVIFETEEAALMHAFESTHKDYIYVILEFGLLEPQYVEKLENTETCTYPLTYTYPFPLTIDKLRRAKFCSLEDIEYV